MSQIVGTNINSNGSFPSGQNATTLQTALDGKVDTLVTLAADTVADILGTDTNTNFPNANVVMGTDGDDTITGTSGSDLIASFGGTDTVNALAGNDKILGGAGVDTLNGGDDNDHLYGYAGADTLNGNAGDDLIYGGKDDDTIDGYAGDDSLYGEAGDDTLTSGAGTDILNGGLGNDTIYVDNTGSKVINASAGTDSLSINYSGLTNLGDFDISESGDYIVLTATNGDTIQFKNIETFSVAGIAYTATGTTNTGYNIVNGYVNTSERTLYLYPGTLAPSAYFNSAHQFEQAFGTKTSCISGDYTIIGSTASESLNLNVSIRDGSSTSECFTGGWIIDMKSGTDYIYSAKLINKDSIDLGAGDDFINLMLNGAGGAATLSTANFAKLDGGSGVDFMLFSESGTNTGELNLNTANATNFEGIFGTDGSETIKGDANTNYLLGYTGSDTVYGYGGGDFLMAHSSLGAGSSDAAVATYEKIINWRASWSGATIGFENDDHVVSEYKTGDNDTTNTLYGGAGIDVLVGDGGEDTLDGGTESDILFGGNGVDTFIIRAGDGGSSLADADLIYDFTDDTDTFGLADINFDDLTIAQGSGSYSNHIIISKTDTSEYISIVRNTSVSNVTAADFASASTDPLTFDGTSGDDIYIGGSGNDIFYTSTGTDTVYAHAGDDTIYVNGTGSKTIDGGAGTDSLSINYSGLTNLGDFDISESGDYIVLTATNGDTIQFKNIETFSVAGIAYTATGTTNTGYNIVNGYVNTSERTLYLYPGTLAPSAYFNSAHQFEQAFGTKTSCISGDYTIIGSTASESLNLNVSIRDGSSTSECFTGGWIIDMKSGTDYIYSAKLINKDSIDLGAGDDFINLMLNGAGGAATLSTANFAKLDGGSGVDFMLFSESGTNTGELNLNTANATNFEGIFGTDGSETIKGDANTNYLLGYTGSDTVYGYGGGDFLMAHSSLGAGSSDAAVATYEKIINWRASWSGATIGFENDDHVVSEYKTGDNDTTNTLYGGAGIDVLVGDGGEDTLDGGTESDILFGGNGVDTFIIRAGDGGSSLADADLIYDFTDDTDTFGLADINFDDLTIAQGSGSYSNHIIISKTDTGEFLAIVRNNSSDNIKIEDFASASTDPLTFDGTSGDDIYIGGSGNDIFYTSTGTDTVYAHAGDDTIYVNGTGSKTIDGGAGTDSLSINYSGLTNLGDFDISESGDYIVLTATNGDTIQFKNIETFSVAGIAYTATGTTNTGYNIVNGYVNTSERTLYLYPGTLAPSAYFNSAHQFEQAFGTKTSCISGDYTIIGSTASESLNLNVSIRDGSSTSECFTGGWIIDMKSGTDYIYSAKLINKDSIDLGAGDDFINLMLNGAGGAATLSTANFAKLDGGSGVDFMLFSESGTNTGELNLNTANATNFEGIFGTDGSETIKGDANTNYLLGYTGSDTVYGYGGGDFLMAHSSLGAGSSDAAVATYEKIINWRASWSGATIGFENDDHVVSEYKTGDNDTTNTLYGGAGIDVLVGDGGEDTLDGGTESDILFGGNGVDTFIIRAGDGGSSLADADLIYDFTDDTDLIGMSGLEYSQLTIEQGTGDYANHVVVKKTDTGEFLVIIRNISLSSISNADFSAI